MNESINFFIVLAKYVGHSPFHPHRSGTVTNSSLAWNLSTSNKESDSSSIEDSGQAYVVGKYAELIIPVSLIITLFCEM